jgi:hypothetical protein
MDRGATLLISTKVEITLNHQLLMVPVLTSRPTPKPTFKISVWMLKSPFHIVPPLVCTNHKLSVGFPTCTFLSHRPDIHFEKIIA